MTTIAQLLAERDAALAYRRRAQGFLLEADKAVGAAEDAIAAFLADADLARISPDGDLPEIKP